MKKPEWFLRLQGDWFFYRSWVIHKNSKKETGFLREPDGKRLAIVTKWKLGRVIRALRRSDPDAEWKAIRFRDYLINRHAIDDGVQLGEPKV